MIDSRECSSPEPDPRVLALLTLSTLTWQRRVQEGQTLGARRPVSVCALLLWWSSVSPLPLRFLTSPCSTLPFSSRLRSGSIWWQRLVSCLLGLGIKSSARGSPQIHVFQDV